MRVVLTRQEYEAAIRLWLAESCGVVMQGRLRIQERETDQGRGIEYVIDEVREVAG